MAADILVQAFTGESSTQGQPGVFVTIEKCGANKDFARQATGPDGKCTFAGLKPGKYCLKFDKVGYNIIVSTCQSTVASNVPRIEQVHVFRKDEIIDPYRVALFLRDRANGDTRRYNADVATLRASGLLTSDGMRIVAAGNTTLPRPVDGTICYSPENGPTSVIASKDSGSVTYEVTDETKFVDVHGQWVERSSVTPNSDVRFVLGKIGDRKVVSKVILEKAKEKDLFERFGSSNVMAREESSSATTTSSSSNRATGSTTATVGGRPY